MADLHASVDPKQPHVVSGPQPDASEQSPVVSGQQPDAFEQSLVVSGQQPDASEQQPNTSEQSLEPPRKSKEKIKSKKPSTVVERQIEEMKKALVVKSFLTPEKTDSPAEPNSPKKLPEESLISILEKLFGGKTCLKDVFEIIAKIVDISQGKLEISFNGGKSVSRHEYKVRGKDLIFVTSGAEINEKALPKMILKFKVPGYEFQFRMSDIDIDAKIDAFKKHLALEMIDGVEKFKNIKWNFAHNETTFKITKATNSMFVFIEGKANTTVTNSQGLEEKYDRAFKIRMPISHKHWYETDFIRTEIINLCLDSTFDQIVIVNFQTDSHPTHEFGALNKEGLKGTFIGVVYNFVYSTKGTSVFERAAKLGITLEKDFKQSLRNMSITPRNVGCDGGCGMTVFPFVMSNRKRFDPETCHKLGNMVLDVFQNKLRRGCHVENGTQATDSFYIRCIEQACKHIGMTYKDFMLQTYETYKNIAKFKEVSTDAGKIPIAEQYITKFMVSLGSTGNHFVEINRRNRQLVVIVHSGSRGAGAAANPFVCQNVDFMEGRGSTAHGIDQMKTAQQVYDYMNIFAAINRASIYYMLVNTLKSSYDLCANIITEVADVHKAYEDLDFVQDYFTKMNIEPKFVVPSLFSGNVHNGSGILAEFKDNKLTGRVAVNLTKGALHGCTPFSIVANKGSEGNDIIVKYIDFENFRTISYKDLEELGDKVEYCTLQELVGGETPELPHGSGRDRSGAKSAEAAGVDLFVKLMKCPIAEPEPEKEDFVRFSFNPGLLPDNPLKGGAYRNSGIEDYLTPYMTRFQYVSIISVKEGIDHSQFRPFLDNVRTVCALYANSSDKFGPTSLNQDKFKSEEDRLKFIDLLHSLDLGLFTGKMSGYDPEFLEYLELLSTMKYHCQVILSGGRNVNDKLNKYPKMNVFA